MESRIAAVTPLTLVMSKLTYFPSTCNARKVNGGVK
jgi:hypothetical protein